MVATVRQISSSSNSGKYFYFTEKNFESGKCWHDSKGIEFLSLEKLTRENFEAVLDGRIPERVDIGGKEEVIERVLGKKTAGGLEHNPGRELIFSSPKSVSIMGLVAGDKRVLEAHEAAVSAVLDYYERNMVFARVQRDGVLQHEKTDNMIAAKFTHICSRVNKDNESADDKKLDIPDPQLHTHCILANVTKCKDGIWRSIVFDKMYDHKMHLGELYRTELGYNLQRIGYELEFQKDKANRWTFEIASVPKEDIATFSKRREKILEVAEQIKRRDSESLALIAKATRQEKVSCTRDSLQENWEMRAMSLEHLRGIINSSVYHTAEKDIKSKLAFSIKHLSEREAVLFKASIIEDLIQKSASDFSIGEIEKGLAECIAEGKLLITYRGDPNSFTTPANLKAERRLISLMQSLLGAMRPIMDKKEIDANIRAKGLTVGQSDAVYLALSTSDRVIGLQGSAGAGKTTVLRTIKECLAAKDYEILGLAPTKSAACTMSDEAGIQAVTMQLFLAKYAGVLAGRGTASGIDKMRSSFKSKIVVLDEAGLASTEQIHGLLSLSKELKFRLMMLGDVKQLGGVETGKPFHYLQEHGLNTVSMSTIKRQQNKELLKSVVLAESAVDAEMRDSKKLISKSLEVLGEKNILDLSKQSQNASRIYTNEDFARALYDKWKELNARGVTPLVIVPSNPMRFLVNAKIRTNYVRGCDIERSVLRSKGLTPASALHIGSYEVGDVLLLNKSEDYLTVLAVDRQEGCLTLKNGMREITLSAANLASMRQGALEVFKPYVLPIAEGERIKWTRNSKTHNFAVNGASARVRKLREGYITVETADKKLHKLPLSDQVLQHIDHDYSSTVYGAQGKTVDHVIGVCRAREKYIDLSTQRALYVMLSRAKHGAFLITDEHERLIKALSIKTGAKYSAIEHLKSSDATDLKALESNRREVWIEKQDAASGPSLENSGLEKNIKIQKIKPSLRYKNFICSPDLIRSAACDAFGSVNEKLSKAENLRFGRRGHIAVNLNTGQWYDFKTGSGGSLHTIFKDASATHNNYEQNVKYLLANTEKSSKIEKIAAVNGSYKRSVSIKHTGATLGAKYFAEHRKIDLSQINLSEDVRFIVRHFSSESKSYHPAIVSFARDQDGKITAAQTIFLDPKDANKNRSLEVTKRTFGSLKGSFVEVTKNKDSKVILIAEGLETSLSLAEANPDLRVVCSLGISNIRNLVFNKDSKVIICADNDGASSNTHFVIEKAAESLRERGVKSVSIVRPDSAGYDFNDVLKSGGIKAVKQYIEPLISKPRSWESIFAKLQADIKEHRTLEQTLQKSVCFNVYKDRRSALKNWNTLAKAKGLEKSAGAVLKNPEILGKMRGINLFGLKTPSRTKALNTIQSDVHSLVQINYNQKAIKAKEKRLKELRHLFIHRYLSGITKLNTKDLDMDTIKEKIFKSVLHALKASDDIINYKSASAVATRIAEQIVHYRIRFSKEASSAEKLSFFSRARFEESRRGLLSAALEEKLQPKTIGQRLAFNQKLSRLLEIDSKNAIKQCDIYYKAAPIESSLKMLESGDKKIEALEKEYIAQGMNASVARFSSIETVKYEEAQGKHMPLKLREILLKTATYVKSNYNQLLKCGFSKEEAIVAYNEGAKLFMQAAQRPKTISLSQVKAAQEISKNEFVTHAKNVHSTTIIPANQAVQKQQNAHITMREFEIGG